ncbi:glycosyltransferase family 4 protein [Flammeovirga kamogawensis]|uniref:Undecaprenyl/decaprenyl-phosphate alpha-N-acetylglucosaminyl 1-phosphate transferase n=1 Tax=Flammeovirga kamogawensis TaxID=373891 RepID=A0ABX8GYM7_9BACT|nr:MraY family glycosyltransferase [Flammeovirga kamogawensis]MBB6458908.1 UDP-N-acetylmuramyl pentapeptide phosphotransferase/UDP-N-acetylglucosamine-1-phosphate transferase [Flammeovirga kamogawensis]QWG08489.1 undecaprenyl/decaprenyl-phosphate alpha-N-acetylglucosaminyl 1-phosphate transferase [Flammeovirga kamogawensis]TRX66784.1 undecaprenyl/decaprenyl-phosphate alpha-N-acetylglucosaminyl 1-phosphate transferase [Flammeovirga kamogawensis]
MLRLIVTLLTSLTIALISTPEVIKVITKNNVFDLPGGRKVHTELIPSMGGVGIFIAFLLSCCIWIPINSAIELRFLFFGIILIFFMGVRDDMLAMSPRNKLIIQLIAATVVVGFGDIQIRSFYSLYENINFPEWFSFATTVFIIIALTNAFNLIDGINGLAGAIAVIITAALSTWFFLIGNHSYAIMMVAMLGGVLGFLYYNWGRATIFMGDTGSMILGFFLSCSLVLFINTDYALPVDHAYKLPDAVSMAIALFIYPIIDTLRVFTIRILNGRSPFSPDRKHIHHIFIRTGFTHAATSTIIASMSFLFLAVCYFANFYIHDLLLLACILTALYVIPLLLKWRVYYYKNNKDEIAKKVLKQKAKESAKFKVERNVG